MERQDRLTVENVENAGVVGIRQPIWYPAALLDTPFGACNNLRGFAARMSRRYLARPVLRGTVVYFLEISKGQDFVDAVTIGFELEYRMYFRV